MVQLGVRLVVGVVVAHDREHVVAEERGPLDLRAGAAGLQRYGRQAQAERGPDGLLLGLGGNVAGLLHLLQNSRAARQRFRRVGYRVVGDRVLHQPGEQRGLIEGQMAGRGREIALRGHLDAIGLILEVRDVQIGRQQLRLGHLVLDDRGDPQLGHFPRKGRRDAVVLLRLGFGGQDAGVLDVLLGQVRPALYRVAR